jgi:hypothetical protein
MRVSIVSLMAAGVLAWATGQAAAYDLDLRVGAADPATPGMNVRVGTPPDRASPDIVVHLNRDLARYRWHDGHWWYRAPDDRWVYYDNDRGWISWDNGQPYQPARRVPPPGVHVAVVPGKVDVKAGRVGVGVDPAGVHLGFGQYSFDIPIRR